MDQARKLLSIITPTYNEEENVEDVHREVARVLAEYPEFDYEHIFIDNDSSDKTVEVLRTMAASDKRVKVIVNARNFGHIRSPHHAFLQAKGDAAILVLSDLQDPPRYIHDFILKWREGYLVVAAVKETSKENPLMFALRKIYYRLLDHAASDDQVRNFHGFGLYDRKFLDAMHMIKDPYPYFRGLVTEIGMPRAIIPYAQERRKKGKTKNNFFTLYDMAMLGFVNHSKLPLRLASFLGFVIATLSLIMAAVYFVLKLVMWDTFQLGLAPLVIGLFFFSAIQLFFIGIMGEYIGSIFTQVKERPHVFERERINF